jgi:hypothetical protein
VYLRALRGSVLGSVASIASAPRILGTLRLLDDSIASAPRISVL